ETQLDLYILYERFTTPYSLAETGAVTVKSFKSELSQHRLIRCVRTVSSRMAHILRVIALAVFLISILHPELSCALPADWEDSNLPVDSAVEVNRVKRQSTGISRTIVPVNDSVEPGGFLFSAVNPPSPMERYAFDAPEPTELTIDATTGRVSLRVGQELSYARVDQRQINFTVLARTIDGRGLYRRMDFQLQLQPTSARPVFLPFSKNIWTALYRQTATMDGAIVYQLRTSVPANMTSALSYEFIPGMTNRSEGRFRVVPDLGYVVTKLNDGYPPAPKHYELGVRAVNNDSATPLTKYGYAFVRVYTTYQNPQFSQDSYTFYLYEESAGVSIGQVLCMSINNIWSTVTLSSKMGPEFNGVFSMSTNGVVSSLTRLDYDLPFAQKVWYFTAVCTENATDPSPRSSEVEVVIRLLDINDNRPYFQLPYYVKPTTTPESLAVNSEVYRVPGFDLDSAPNALLTYTLTGTNSAWFNVSTDPVTREAIIYVQSPLDYDILPVVTHTAQFVISVSDGVSTGVSPQTSATVFIPLQNSNDNAPQMRNFTASVQRKSTAGVIIIQLQAQDIDGSGVNYYFWTGAASAQYPSAGNPQLVIDEKTGIVTVGSATLSSATDARYEIPIRAIDDGSCDGCPPGATTPLRSEIGYLTLTVVDSNNVAPVFTNCPTTNPEFTEQSPVDTPLVQVNAVNQDGSTRGGIQYAIVYNTLISAPEDYFKVNATTGTISSNSVIDIEQIPMVTLKNYFWLTVRATNIFNGLSSYCTFQVNFIDINDEPPVFDQDEFFTRVIDSSLPSGSFVGEISAYDPDVPNTQMSTVQYFIVNSTPGGATFTISSNNNLGTIRTSSVISGLPDKTQFTLTIESRNPVPLTGTTKTWNRKEYRIYVTTQRALLPPVVTTSPPESTITVKENFTLNAILFNMTASSQDGATRTYEWYEPGRANYVPTNAPFGRHFGMRSASSTSCTSNTCSVAVSRSFAFENYNVFYVRVRTSYKDRDPTIGEIYTDIYKRVLIEDVNNWWPNFITRSYIGRVFVLENAARNSFVTQAFAVDLDFTANFKRVVYSLDPAASNDSAYFSINPNTGAIATNTLPSTFNAEGTQTNFRLQVVASDSAPSSLEGVIGPNTKTLALAISVSDVNDNAPFFPRSGYSFSIREDAAIGTIVGRVNGSDLDANDLLRYKISSGDPTYRFITLVDTGDIVVAKPLSYFDTPSFSLTYTVSDGVNTATAQVNITVISVYNMAPSFIPSSFVNITNVTENSPAQTIWMRNRGTLPVSYSLTGRWTTSPTQYFSVNPTTGALSTTRRLDREESPVYRFNAIASNGLQQAYSVVEVWPIDANDNRPTWNFTSLFGMLPEGAAIGVPFMQLRTNDPDTSGTINFALVSNPTDGSEYVSVNSNGQVITTANLGIPDSERLPPKAPLGIFSFVVTVTDGVGSPVTGTASVSIVDVNDNPPVFDQTVYTVNVPEVTAVGENIFTAAATDADKIDDGQLTYQNLDYLDYFTVKNVPDINGGAVILNKQLDYENVTMPKSFVVRIRVTDSTPPPYTASCTLIINVVDSNDNAPVITFNPAATITRQEGPTSVGPTGVAFSATDADAVDTSFTFWVLPESDPFSNLQLATSSTGGTINIQTALNREVWNPPASGDAVHNYIIMVTDGRGMTGSATLTVTITDVNNSPPYLLPPTGVTIMENSIVGTVAQPTGLRAEDKDTPPNGAPFTFSQDGSAGNNWTGNFVLDSSGQTFNIRSLKSFDRETDGKEFLLRVLIRDRGGLTGTGTVTVTIGDVDDNPTFSNGYKQVYVYIYEGNYDYWFNASTRIELGYAVVFDRDDWDRSLKTYTMSSQQYFEMDSLGGVTLKGGTPANNYTINVEVKDAQGVTAWCRFDVTVNVLPNDALANSGSMVIDNMDSDAFVRRERVPSSQTLGKDNFPDYISSAYDNFKITLANLLGTSFDKTHIFYVADIPGSRSIIVRFTASGSPFYLASRLAGLVSVNSETFTKMLARYNATMRMTPYDGCRSETDGPAMCSSGCKNVLNIEGSNTTSVLHNSTALIGITITTVAQCGCQAAARVAPSRCGLGSCFHDGNCTNVAGSNTFTCQCPAGYEGPRCERLQVGFSTADSFLALTPLPGGCMNFHLRFYFITNQVAARVLLLYTGISGVSNSLASSITMKDFLAIELVNGKPQVTIELGSGVSTGGLHNVTSAPALNDSKWHRIDLFLRDRQVVLKVDGCQGAPTSLDGDPTVPNLSNCLAYWTVAGVSKKLNVASFPLYLGGRNSIASANQYPASLSTTGFIGAVAKLMFNSAYYDLYTGPRAWYSGATNDYVPLTASCNSSDGTRLCQNGWCWGALGGAVGSGSCVCYSGYRKDASGRCSVPLEVSELKTNSYMLLKVKSALTAAYTKQGVKLDVQFRTRSTDGTLLRVTSSDPYRPEHMELLLRRSQLVYVQNMGDYVYREVVLPNANVSDGAWHWVQVRRTLRDVELSLDNGEDYNYAYRLGNLTSNYNYIVFGDLASVGAQLTSNSTGLSISPPSTDLVDTCVSTVRIDEAWLPVQAGLGTNSAAMATMSASSSIVSGCANDLAAVCPASATCPATMVCLPAWRPMFIPVCGCESSFILYNGQCRAAGACLYTNPCVNGVCSLVGGLPRCTCNAGWQGDRCDVAAFALGSASLIVILVLLGLFVLLLLAFLIWYCCFAGRKGENLLLDAPFENVIDYNEEGGGQEDKLNFDMTQLRVLVSDTTVVKQTVTNVQSSRTDFNSMLQSRLALADAGPQPTPFDGVLDYEYEGRGAVADDLDSIVSGDNGDPQSYDFLTAWGPKFTSVAQIYTCRPDDADDLGSEADVDDLVAMATAGRGEIVTATTVTATRRS
ncbi:hypothetical protein BOX15_Mlig015809g3, partial [Macrostomum lignano]